MVHLYIYPPWAESKNRVPLDLYLFNDDHGRVLKVYIKRSNLKFNVGDIDDVSE